MPAGRLVCGGTSTRPLAAASELITCEACRPAERIFPAASTFTRMKCRRGPGFDSGSASTPGCRGEQKSGLIPAKDKRPTGFDRDFPELQLTAGPFEGDSDEIHVTDRHAARSHDHLAFGEGLFQRLPRRVERVGDEREHLGNCSSATQQRAQADAVAVINLAWPQRLARLSQFRASRQQAGDWPSSHANMGTPGSGQQTDSTGGQKLTCLGEQLPPFHVFSAVADVFRWFGGVQEQHLARIARLDSGILLYHDRIGPGWQGRTGE